MAESVVARLKSAWNVFRKNEQEDLTPQNGDRYYEYGMVSSYARPDRIRLTRGTISPSLILFTTELPWTSLLLR